MINNLLQLVKEKNPLVHHITNYVTVNDCANIVLALGGSPVMADDKEEVEDMVSLASALVINMGTLNSRTIESMLLAGKKAKALSIPVIFDPVGAGATPLRREIAQKILKEIKPTVIRGNMSEIKVLAGFDTITKGVDSLDDTENGSDLAKKMAKKWDCIMAITGSVDIITDGQKVCLVKNGHPFLAKITGTGCMCTSLVGTYCGVTEDYYAASIAGVISMGLAGEFAFENLTEKEGLGTFKMHLFDFISNLKPEDIATGGKFHEI